jgi:SAM-dependent methyltransferase
MPEGERPSLASVFRGWWKDGVARDGFFPTLRWFLKEMWEFARDSTPARRRQRYGDVDYDWNYRVDTTSATVGWRQRLLGVFLSGYQATEPAAFHRMLGSLGIDFRQFTFIDLGSGKGRTLLMASDYPFRRILGVEILPELHRVAQENIARYKSDAQTCFAIESLCGDARQFEFPAEPTLLYLFNPLPEAGLTQAIANLECSLRQHPRPVYVLYHNPLLEHVLAGSALLKGVGGTQQCSTYVAT